MKRFKIKYISFLILFLFVFLLSGCASNTRDNTTSVANEKIQVSNNAEQGIKTDENSKIAR